MFPDLVSLNIKEKYRVEYHKDGKAASGLFAIVSTPPGRGGEQVESFDQLYNFLLFHVLVGLSLFSQPTESSTTIMDSESITESKTVHEVKIDIPADPESHGYDHLASFMGFFPEAAIFRRFAVLNAKNILYLQAELLWLEKELDAVAEDDAQSTNAKRREYSKEWFLLRQSVNDPHGDSQQWKIFKKIRKTLDKYSRDILFYISVFAWLTDTSL
jgi:hypothetical protein